MSTNLSIQQLQQAETEIAVLKVKLDNLDEKVDEIKAELSEVHDKMEENADKFSAIVTSFQAENTKSHKEMSEKISNLEKWRWMIMGGGIAIGVIGSYVATALIRVLT